jgi:hypothetical protein
MNKRFEKAVLGLRPTWHAVSRYYFCMSPANLVMCGFAWDRTQGGVYIWRFAHPLFETKPLTLSFGLRLPYPEDFLPIAQGGEEAAASEFVSRVAPHESATSRLSEPAEFLAHVEALNSFRNPWVTRGYALTLIMLGRMSDAAAQLDLLLGGNYGDGIPGFKEEVVGVARALSSDPGALVSVLRERAVENKRALGLV